MALTDVQIYDLRPDVKALNEEYVALGKAHKEADAAVGTAHDALANAEAGARDRIVAAQAEVQTAQAALDLATAEETTKVKTAKRQLDAATRHRQIMIDRRAQVQLDHNGAIEDVQREYQAKTVAEAAKSPKDADSTLPADNEE